MEAVQTHRNQSVREGQNNATSTAKQGAASHTNSSTPIPRPTKDISQLVLTLTEKGIRMLDVINKCPTLTLYRGGWGALDEKKGILDLAGPIFVSKAMSYQNHLEEQSGQAQMLPRKGKEICVVSEIQNEQTCKFFSKPKLNVTLMEKKLEKLHNKMFLANVPEFDTQNSIDESYLEQSRKADELERANHAKSTYLSGENNTMPSKYISSTYSLKRAREWASAVIYKFTPYLEHAYLGSETEKEILILGGSCPDNVEVSVNFGKTFMSLQDYKLGLKKGIYQ